MDHGKRVYVLETRKHLIQKSLNVLGRQILR